MKVSVKDGKISIQTKTRKRLERFGEVEIVGESKGFELDFIKKTDILPQAYFSYPFTGWWIA